MTSVLLLCPGQESDLHQSLRRALLYPLSYQGKSNGSVRRIDSKLKVGYFKEAHVARAAPIDLNGMSYTGSTTALGAVRQGSIPCIPTKKGAYPIGTCAEVATLHLHSHPRRGDLRSLDGRTLNVHSVFPEADGATYIALATAYGVPRGPDDARFRVIFVMH